MGQPEVCLCGVAQPQHQATSTIVGIVQRVLCPLQLNEPRGSPLGTLCRRSKAVSPSWIARFWYHAVRQPRILEILNWNCPTLGDKEVQLCIKILSLGFSMRSCALLLRNELIPIKYCQSVSFKTGHRLWSWARCQHNVLIAWTSKLGRVKRALGEVTSHSQDAG